MLRHKYSLRLLIVFFFFCVLYGIIIIRLYIIQIMHHDFYYNYAQKQYVTTFIDLPTRALIYDRNNIPLAQNKHAFSAFIIPKQIKHKEKTYSFLQTYFPPAYQQVKHSLNKHFLFVKRNLHSKEIDLIKKEHITAIKFLSEPYRYYPNEASASIIGCTTIDNNGAEGIEYLFNKQLQGKPTTYKIEQDARRSNFYFKKELIKNGTHPKSIRLTLDAKLQTLCHQELLTTCKQFGAKAGAILVMNPDNGDILVMTSYGKNKYKNICVTDAYELGSVMKIFASLAAIEENIVSLDTIIDCQNTKHGIVNNRTINTVTAHDKLYFIDVIARSNNIGMAVAIEPLGKKLYTHYKQLGFGEKILLPLPGIQSGFVNHYKNWSAQSLFSLSYGYEISATLLQLAQAFCVIANNGETIQPRIIYNKEKQKKIRLYSKASCEKIKTILQRTVTHGTARQAYIKKVNVMCKTGTANLLNNGKYDQTKNIFTCAGIISHENYQRIIVTFIKEIKHEGRYSSTIAAPLFKNIAEQLLIAEHVVIH